MKIIFDTNFCLIPFEFKVDIFDELNRIIPEKYEIVIPNSVKEELKEISTKKNKRGIAAKSALEMIKKFKEVKLENIGGVDKSIMEFARKEGYAIATQDKKIKSTAKKYGIPIITMRKKKYLIFIQ